MTEKRITDEDLPKVQEAKKRRLPSPFGHYTIMAPQPMHGKSLATKWVKENYSDIKVVEGIPSNLKGNAPTPLETVMKYLSEYYKEE